MGLLGSLWPLIPRRNVRAAQTILTDPRRVVEAAETMRAMQQDDLFIPFKLTVNQMIRAEEEIARANRSAGAIDVDFEVMPEPKALIGDGR